MPQGGSSSPQPAALTRVRVTSRSHTQQPGRGVETSQTFYSPPPACVPAVLVAKLQTTTFAVFI